MFKKVYYWVHKNIVKRAGEKDEPSGGWWHNKIRQEAVNLSKGCRGKLLEVGCGEGLFITNLASINPQLEIFGIDTDKDKLLNAGEKCETKKLDNVKLMHASALDLPFSENYFDKIVCINTFFNMDSIDVVRQALAQMTRVCKKGGRIIFDFRNSLNPLLKLKYKLAPYYDATIKEDKLPLNTYSPKRIGDILKKLNLEIFDRIFIGFPKNILAPIIIIEAKKC